MARIFIEHKKRKTQSLDGAWKFLTDKNDVGKEKGYGKRLPDGETVIVPSVWNTEKALLKYEGAVWYEKSFYTEGGCLRLHFGAVMTECEVYFDGELVGGHYGGFCEFDFIVPEVTKGMHVLILRVDNRFDEHSIPQKYVDWYHYGGITRSVTVETLEGICVLNHRFEYTLSDGLTSAECTPTVTVYNADKIERESVLSLKLEGETRSKKAIKLGGGESADVMLPAFTLDNPRLWNPGAAELYEIEIATESDDLYDRIGFRRVEVKDCRLFINGVEIEICGVNRHNDHPDFGMAFPPARMKYDIDLISDMGCNAIRGSHYPNSRDFVDMLDERGFIFWSEIPIWGGGFSQQALGDKIVVERGLEMHREMVKYYYNHPSVIFWGMHNEILSDTNEAYEMTKLYYEYLKENGGNRAVVYASDKPLIDICFEYSDIICINRYHGWYSGGMEQWDKFLPQMDKKLEELGLSNRPMIISEFGAGAIYGFHDAEMPKWSEEYQAKLMDHCLSLFHEHPTVIGTFIWQFCDMRTAEEMGFSRARGFNNKGIMNEYRRPKAAYYTAQKHFRSFLNK